MEEFNRQLTIDLPKNQSAFLWGARKTGKTTLLRKKFPKSIFIDFLQTDTFLEYIKSPFLLRERLLARPEQAQEHPVVIDEVQKVPQVLDEVHWLIENKGLNFILCGSSARKLKRGQANLLGGRAWRFELFPLVSKEVKDLDLLRALNNGLIPSHYLQANYKRSLRGYVQDYLQEEVFHEGLTRNIPAFSRFFEAMGYSHGSLVNYSNIARECGVSSKTVKEYYQILVDTLLGTFVLPFKRKQERQVISKAPKFYLFDTGVAGALSKRKIAEEKGEVFGNAFEHFIYLEMLAHSAYHEIDYNINFWRTKSGQEVDFILGDGEVAVEVKGSAMVDKRALRPMKSFNELYAPKQCIVVCNESEERIHSGIRIMPWRIFLKRLWRDEILK
ncbi:MAG: ATP-binding protein [Deltaproteobacteria bacterium]|nr:ATP-binding protein [Deltaproteobacteria bacterium]